MARPIVLIPYLFRLASAHRDEGRDVPDPVGVQVLQLDLIMVQQTWKNG